jgi:hypothetical protein
MLSSAATIALALAAPGGCALPALAADRPWSSGERLAYDVEALGVTRAMAVALAVDAPTAAGAQLELRAEASLRLPFYRLRGSARSWIDEGLRPRRFRDETDDGTLASTDSQPERPGQAVRVYWTHGGKKGMDAFVRGPAVLDLVSSIYYLRSARLTPGSSFCFDAVGGRHYWRLSGRVGGATERVETRVGRFEAVRLDGVAVQADDPSRRYPLHLWLGLDARRLPLALSAETGAGTVRAVLSSATSAATDAGAALTR